MRPQRDLAGTGPITNRPGTTCSLKLQIIRADGTTLESPVVRFQVPEREEDRKTAEEILRQLDLCGGYSIVNPGAGWPSSAAVP